MSEVQNAFSVADGHPVWLVPCKFCGKVHSHGVGEGHRLAHCGSHPGKPSAGYDLALSGPATDELIAKVFGRHWRSVVARQVEETRRHRLRLARAKTAAASASAA
jgi:hypothetical protein